MTGAKASLNKSKYSPYVMDYRSLYLRVWKRYAPFLVSSPFPIQSKIGLRLRLKRFPKPATSLRIGATSTRSIVAAEDAPAPPSDADVKATLGVDLGLRHLATDSAGHQFQGTDLADYRSHRADVRAWLQAKAHRGTKATRKACRRALKRLSGRERRHQKQINHEISKHLVSFALKQGVAIVFEQLKGIRDRCRVRKAHRRRLNSWAFYQLQQFVEYKAKQAGVRMVYIDPRYTSQTCSNCLHIGIRRQDDFACKDCGHRSHADLNAARNIARWGLAVIRGEYSLLSCPLPSGGRVGG